MNSISIATALLMMSTMRDSGSRLISFEYSRHAKSQWSPLSRLISSLLKHRPGIKPHFFSQKIAQKEPEKKSNHAFSEAGGGGVTPFESLLHFALNAWYFFNPSEEMLFL